MTDFITKHYGDIRTPATEPQFWGLDSPDLHCWVELDGKILDYPVKVLEKCSQHGTKNVKYVPFHKDLQPLLEEKWRKSYNLKVKEFAEFGSMLPIDYNIFWVVNGGFCFYRSIIIADRLKAKGLNPKIVYGSLGFVQKDGSVYYEYG